MNLVTIHRLLKLEFWFEKVHKVTQIIFKLILFSRKNQRVRSHSLELRPNCCSQFMSWHDIAISSIMCVQLKMIKLTPYYSVRYIESTAGVPIKIYTKPNFLTQKNMRNCDFFRYLNSSWFPHFNLISFVNDVSSWIFWKSNGVVKRE